VRNFRFTVDLVVQVDAPGVCPDDRLLDRYGERLAAELEWEICARGGKFYLGTPSDAALNLGYGTWQVRAASARNPEELPNQEY
jgi:hypothetical protein